ncbi:MAG: SET domain-containing protein-lysine N-methyltransferase [Sneathiella sp.]|uniref:SET domain-containing protein n=1 Tax=Sneathiella sp. TaxID=1964365 RepID=UPI000C5A9E6F|nr:SET domain-containing protein-lysine N-methyltransferase [Sneathiella sp.]MAZ01726.1 SET domain-containing protein-lysine N-methyltransferase [Sneathiella sp.]|tara:strand:+ start:33 stop:467 length:435 start_codon:yes stop_codon:yes gene_type:complete
MMLVRTYAAPSAVEGVGVFAAEKIRKGTLIWQYQPSFDRLVPAEMLSTASPVIQEFLRKYAYPAHDEPGMLVIEVDNGRLMNHSEEPNTNFTKITEGYATRDILEGEELLCDYREFDPEFELLPSLVAEFAARSLNNGHAHGTN